MNFDDILIKLGEFGKYQKILYFLTVCLPSATAGVVMVISVFLLGVPKHRSVFSVLVPSLSDTNLSCASKSNVSTRL